MPAYPPHPPMYFPYPMAPSMFTSSGGGDTRNRIGMSSHPFFSHLPRLGYSSAHLHLPPPPLHHSDGGGGGHYPRPGRPWWTVPPFPPPSHLHHPHHNHPPPNDNDRPFQDQHPPPSVQQTPQVTTSASEHVSTATTSPVPRTTSRNAYTQQRLSILRKQQQKEQVARTIKEQDIKHQFMSNCSAMKSDVSLTVMKTEDNDSAVDKYTSKEGKGVRNYEESAKFNSNFKPNQ